MMAVHGCIANPCPVCEMIRKRNGETEMLEEDLKNLRKEDKVEVKILEMIELLRECGCTSSEELVKNINKHGMGLVAYGKKLEEEKKEDEVIKAITSLFPDIESSDIDRICIELSGNRKCYILPRHLLHRESIRDFMSYLEDKLKEDEKVEDKVSNETEQKKYPLRFAFEYSIGEIGEVIRSGEIRDKEGLISFLKEHGLYE